MTAFLPKFLLVVLLAGLLSGCPGGGSSVSHDIQHNSIYMSRDGAIFVVHAGEYFLVHGALLSKGTLTVSGDDISGGDSGQKLR